MSIFYLHLFKELFIYCSCIKCPYCKSESRLPILKLKETFQYFFYSRILLPQFQLKSATDNGPPELTEDKKFQTKPRNKKILVLVFNFVERLI